MGLDTWRLVPALLSPLFSVGSILRLWREARAQLQVCQRRKGRKDLSKSSQGKCSVKQRNAIHIRVKPTRFLLLPLTMSQRTTKSEGILSGRGIFHSSVPFLGSLLILLQIGVSMGQLGKKLNSPRYPIPPKYDSRQGRENREAPSFTSTCSPGGDGAMPLFREVRLGHPKLSTRFLPVS